MLTIVEKACRVEDGKLVIVVEGDNPEEVLSNTAKTLAMQKAASFGYPRVGINGQTGSFPVDKEGNTYDDWNDQSRRGLIAAYRNEIKLMGGL
jgi:hypothetical protein